MDWKKLQKRVNDKLIEALDLVQNTQSVQSRNSTSISHFDLWKIQTDEQLSQLRSDVVNGRQVQDKLEKDLGKITQQTSKIRHDLIRDNQTTARELTYRMNESDQRLKKSERKLNDITKNTDFV